MSTVTGICCIYRTRSILYPFVSVIVYVLPVMNYVNININTKISVCVLIYIFVRKNLSFILTENEDIWTALPCSCLVRVKNWI